MRATEHLNLAKEFNIETSLQRTLTWRGGELTLEHATWRP
jgi:hypothetical protein